MKKMKTRQDVYHYKVHVLQVAQLRTSTEMNPESAPLPAGHLAVVRSVCPVCGHTATSAAPSLIPAVYYQ